jgi:hypothetical protein
MISGLLPSVSIFKAQEATMGAARRIALTALMISSLAVPAMIFALDGQVVYSEGTVTVTSGGASQDASPGMKVSQ